MALEYFLDHECPVKKAMSMKELAAMVKRRKGAERILRVELGNGISEQEARGMAVSWDIHTPGKDHTVSETTVGELLDGTRILDELGGSCKGCPAALGQTFGCYGAINFPISARAEQWLGEQAVKSFGRDDPGSYVVKLILEQKVDGERFNALRADQKGAFFDLKKPLEITISKGLFGKKTVNTNQIIDFLLGARKIHGKFLVITSFFSGGVTIRDREPEPGTFLSAFVAEERDGKEIWWVYNLPQDETDDTSTAQLKWFFNVGFRALQLDEPIFLDM